MGTVDRQLELPGLNLSESQWDRLLALRPALRPSRRQQFLLAVSALILITLFLFPPHMTLVAGHEQFLGFYSLFGSDAQQALQAGEAPVFLHSRLLGLMVFQITAITLLLFGALSMTREDWAATLARFLQDATSINTADTIDLVHAQPNASPVPPSRKASGLDWDLRHLPASEPPGVERPYELERAIIRKAMRLASQGKIVEADSLLRRCLEQVVFLPGAESPFAAEVTFRLANLLRDSGRFAEAEDFYLQSIELYERSLGENDPSLVSVLWAYGKLLRTIERVEPAQRLENEAKRLRELGHNHVDALPLLTDIRIAQPEQVLQHEILPLGVQVTLPFIDS